MRQCLAHALVGQRRICTVEIHVGVAGCWSPIDAQFPSGLDARHVLRRHWRLYEVEIATLQRDNASGVVRHDLDAHAVEVRTTTVEAIVGRELDGVAGRPPIDLERARTDRFSAEVRSQILDRRLRHDRQVHV